MPGFIIHPTDVVATTQRREKLARWCAQGVDPYPRRPAGRTEIAEARRAPERDGAWISIAGRLTARRPHGSLLFLDLRDGSGSIEARAHRQRVGDARYRSIRALDVGDFVELTGSLGRTRCGEPLFETHTARLLAKALRPSPARTIGAAAAGPHAMDLLASQQARELLKLRARTFAAVRTFFDARGYVEVDVPILERSWNGNGARPFLTNHHARDRRAALRSSMQLQLRRCIVAGVDRVYDLGKCFRNEGTSPRHNPEFTMLEWSTGYHEYRDAAATLEQLVAFVALQVLGTTTIERGGERIELAPPWRRCSFREATLEATGIDVADADPRALADAVGGRAVDGASWANLVRALYQKRVEPTLRAPTIVLDWPTDLLPLSKRHQDQPAFAEAFDAVVAGMELASGDSDVNDPVEQAARFRAARNGDEPDLAALAHEAEVVATLEYGMPPVGGAGLGVDRLVMLLADRPTLRDVLTFPETT